MDNTFNFGEAPREQWKGPMDATEPMRDDLGENNFGIESQKKDKGNIEDMIKEIIYYNADPDACNRNYETPLHRATISRSHPAIRELVLHGANVNCVDLEGRTPLHIAAENRDRDTFKYLLEAKANVNLIDSKRQTPLFILCK